MTIKSHIRNLVLRVQKAWYYSWDTFASLGCMLMIPALFMGIGSGLFGLPLVDEMLPVGIAFMCFPGVAFFRISLDRIYCVGGYGILRPQSIIGWCLKLAYNNTEHFAGKEHSRYAAALIPGTDDGITSLVIGKWSDKRYPSIIHCEQINVGDQPEELLLEHISSRLLTLREQARTMEEKDFLDGVPSRISQVALEEYKVRQEKQEKKLRLRQQKQLAEVFA